MSTNNIFKQKFPQDLYGDKPNTPEDKPKTPTATTWEELKEKGNEEFKNKNFNSAINIYSQAIGK